MNIEKRTQIIVDDVPHFGKILITISNDRDYDIKLGEVSGWTVEGLYELRDTLTRILEIFTDHEIDIEKAMRR